MVDLSWRDMLLGSSFQVVSANRIEGFRRSSSWAKDHTVYFVADFSANFSKVHGYRNQGSVIFVTTLYEDSKIISVTEPSTWNAERLRYSLGIFQEITVCKGRDLLRLIEGARKNLEAELPHWDFDKVRADARRREQRE